MLPITPITRISVTKGPTLLFPGKPFASSFLSVSLYFYTHNNPDLPFLCCESLPAISCPFPAGSVFADMVNQGRYDAVSAIDNAMLFIRSLTICNVVLLFKVASSFLILKNKNARLLTALRFVFKKFTDESWLEFAYQALLTFEL